MNLGLDWWIGGLVDCWSGGLLECWSAGVLEARINEFVDGFGFDDL